MGQPFDPIVFYHANCFDGFTAAWCAHHFMPNAELIPVGYGDPVPYNLVEGHDIFVLDFSWSREDMLRLYDMTHSNARALLVLDHHASHQEALEGLDFAIFDMDKSGAGLTWAYFYPTIPMPKWIAHVQDRDIWTLRMEGTQEFHSYLGSIPMTLAEWTRVATSDLLDMIGEGTSIRRYLLKEIDELAKRARVVNIEGAQVNTLNMPQVRSSSDLLHRLAVVPGIDYSLTWAQSMLGEYTYSVRSDGDFDVSVVAQRYGGGGHRAASGFRTPQLLPELLT